MQMDVHKTLYHFYTTTKSPILAGSQLLYVYAIYTIGYLQISNHGTSFQGSIATV